MEDKFDRPNSWAVAKVKTGGISLWVAYASAGWILVAAIIIFLTLAFGIFFTVLAYPPFSEPSHTLQMRRWVGAGILCFSCGVWIATLVAFIGERALSARIAKHIPGLFVTAGLFLIASSYFHW